MAKAKRYPKANTTTQWFQGKYPGTDMGGVEKVLLHTTETGTWPGYGGGASAPTLTYDPRKRQWRQHFDLNRSARALRDPSGTSVRENRDRVVQVEIICSCDKAFARKYGYPYVADLSAGARQDIAEFIAFMHREWGVPLVAAPLWLSYPSSYGNSAARMSGPTYDRFKGVLGHQHASGNTHGDPGDIDIDDIMRRAKAIVNPPTSTPQPEPQPTPTEDDMPQNHYATDRPNTQLAPGKFTDVVPVLSSPGTMHGLVRLQVTPLRPPTEVHVDCVEYDPDDKLVRQAQPGQQAENISGDGWFGVPIFVWTTVPKGRIYIRVKVFQEGVTVPHVVVQGGRWAA